MMDRLMDDEELAGAILSGFLADTPKQIENLIASLSAGDLQGAEHWAHTLKGESANIGGGTLAGRGFRNGERGAGWQPARR